MKREDFYRPDWETMEKKYKLLVLCNECKFEIKIVKV